MYTAHPESSFRVISSAGAEFLSAEGGESEPSPSDESASAEGGNWGSQY